jgi:tetratricopeptide (TPR) repeat protein
MATDWFRQKDWNEKIEQEFFVKLARARTQRDQYLVIQAQTISQIVPTVALRLVDLYFDTKKDNFEDVRALSAKADAYLALGQTELAIEAMKSILAIERARPNHKTTKYLDYPFLVATQQISSEYHDALAVLEERKSDLMFPLDKFKWHAAKSLIHHSLRELDDSKRHAALALEAAKVKMSGFRYHQDLGLVGEEHKDTVASLRQIYA